jgi:1-acyl-sn-glycerol-3-phosphate acyltransferase
VENWQLKPAHDLGLSAAERFKGLRRESGLIATGLHLAWWSLVRGYMRIWHRLTVRGREHIPASPPFILVANHTSHLDVLVLGSALPWWLSDRVFPVAAGDVFFTSPLRSALSATILNALPMWRKKCGPHALHDLRSRLLEDPCAYILFPEGCRSRDGAMLPFKPGLGMLVAETAVPIVPCYLDGCFEALRPETIWPRRRRISLHIGESVSFANVRSNRSGWEYIAHETETRVRSLAPRSTVASRCENRPETPRRQLCKVGSMVECPLGISNRPSAESHLP